MNVKQIVWECGGPPLGSYVLNACIGVCRICVHANELAVEWPDPPTLI